MKVLIRHWGQNISVKPRLLWALFVYVNVRFWLVELVVVVVVVVVTSIVVLCGAAAASNEWEILSVLYSWVSSYCQIQKSSCCWTDKIRANLLARNRFCLSYCVGIILNHLYGILSRPRSVLSLTIEIYNEHNWIPVQPVRTILHFLCQIKSGYFVVCNLMLSSWSFWSIFIQTCSLASAHNITMPNMFCCWDYAVFLLMGTVI